MRTTRRRAIGLIATAAMAARARLALAGASASSNPSAKYQIAEGPFQPAIESLKAYKAPSWFGEAKFGMWAHWGPQGVAEHGDWYARHMYEEDDAKVDGDYNDHLKRWGHPSKFGYKDLCELWKAERFDPDHLIELYKSAGAKYFVSQGCHHDNFDNWNSAHHRWNSAKVGPQKDIVGLWREATLKHGLRFGVSEHLAVSYKWWAAAHQADTIGPMAGVPYDANDPQWEDLYHPGYLGETIPWDDLWSEEGHPRWWKEQWFLRIKDLIDQHRPDYVYTDFGNVPFRHDYGWQLLAHYYNQSIRDHGGKLEAVYTGKGETDIAFSRDFESTRADQIRPEPWQTDTCIGSFFYDTRLLDGLHPDRKYKTADSVIRMLVDIVSKNGNLLLSIPQRPDGTIDDYEQDFLGQFAAWMAINQEAIFASKPYRVFGEGPSKIPPHGGEGNSYTAEDIRFTVKGDSLYAIVLGLPQRETAIKTLGRSNPQVKGEISGVKLLGYQGTLRWARKDDALAIEVPARLPCDHAVVFKINGLA